MKRMILLMAALTMVFAAACSQDEAKDAAGGAESAASDLMNKAGAAADAAAKAATDRAHNMVDSAKDAAGDMAGSAAETCRSLAESGSWGSALEVCKKAHEMMPDDLGLEHAYQQAQAASGN